jgi:hypothetical protein
MTEFFIDEDFPCNQVEFEERFNTEQACRDYLANMKCPVSQQVWLCHGIKQKSPQGMNPRRLYNGSFRQTRIEDPLF